MPQNFNPFNKASPNVSVSFLYNNQQSTIKKSRWNRYSFLGFIEERLKEIPPDKLVFRTIQH